MYITIIYLIIQSFLITSLLGRKIGRKGVQIIANILMLLALFLAINIFYEIGLTNKKCLLIINNWIELGSLKVNWGFYYDSLTSVMLIIIILISLLVNLYSIEYMKNDPHFIRFQTYLTIFTFFMLILVTADNLLQMFLGWEGVGLSSYLLINFWYTRQAANKSAIKAIIINRIGDLGLIMAIIMIYLTYKTLDFNIIFSLVKYKIELIEILGFKINNVSLISFLLFIGTVGKSAQLGLHTWLPDAMEGPTPVSALIHAATMVTAGIFLLLRCSPIISYSNSALAIITILGAITAFFGAITAVFQNDLKKVIAYSTCSQLGYMVYSCGLTNYAEAIFHLTNHAFFKALLFLTAGSVIHALQDEQDIRKMGGLAKILPFTYQMFLIGSLAIIGFPFLSGFYSKDIIIETSFVNFIWSSTFSFYLATLSAGLTAFYSFRLLNLTFLTKTNIHKSKLALIHEPGKLMIFSLSILAILSLFSGYMLKDMFLGLGTDFWNSAIFNLSNKNNQIDSEFLPILAKLAPTIVTFTGILYAQIIYNRFNFPKFRLEPKITKITYFFSKKWGFDKVFLIIILFGLNLSKSIMFKLIDKGILERLAPKIIIKFIFKSSKLYKLQQIRFFTNYLFQMLLGLNLLILIFILK